MTNNPSRPPRISQRPSMRPSQYPLLVSAPLVAIMPALLACGSASEHPNDIVSGYDQPNDTPKTTDVASGPCTAGATRKCSVILGTYEGVVSCFVGIQTCVEGQWSKCHSPDEDVTASGGSGGSAGEPSGSAGAENVGGAGGFGGTSAAGGGVGGAQ
jgi:hypothetical protein